VDVKELVIVSADDMSEIPAGLEGFEAELRSPRRLAVRYMRSKTEIGQLLDVVRQAGVTIHDLSTDEPDLEDVFLHLTGSGRATPPDAANVSHRGGIRGQGIPGRRGPPGEDPSRPGGL
jgi:ABC-2 type transport system ATP-binding protein